MPDITTVLLEDTDYKGAEWSLNGSPESKAEFDSGFTMIKLNDKKTPTWADLQEKLVVLQTEYDALAYSRSRKVEYDKLNQFELMYDDKVNSTDKWGEAIVAIKNKFPK